MDILPIFRMRSLLARIYFRIVFAPFLARAGHGSVVVRPRGIQGARNIYIGIDAYVADGSFIAAVPHTDAKECSLIIGDRCKLGANNHVYATHCVVFEDDVLTAGNVYVADNSHTFVHVDTPILQQPIRQLSKVRIGSGSWLGQNVCIIGASVGKGCVIGANSIVTSDIPDFCVAAGAPAKVVRRYDHHSGQWLKEVVNDDKAEN
jgi:acetyltransferase-like isoleucine patch superfamily enzyme